MPLSEFEQKYEALVSTSARIIRSLKNEYMGCDHKIDKNRESVFESCSKLDIDQFVQILVGTSSNSSFQISFAGENNFLNELLSTHVQIDRSVGSYMGMVLGDYLGAPIEFLETTNSSNSIEFSDKLALGYRYPSLVNNVFNLEPGQWTDDASMGACVADTLLVRQKFVGSDIRSRFWQWWNVGYNNAFKFSSCHSPYCSVGLGGNISKSLQSINGKKFTDIPEKFEENNHDAGNGGLMRLAPIPIFYSDQGFETVMQNARLSSETTHPGYLASRAAEFMAFFIHCAINRTNSDISPKDFSDNVVLAYLQSYCNELVPGNSLLRKLLLSNETEASTELSWNWKDSVLNIEKCMKNRGKFYNGYPNNLSYYGSFCMDALAVGLHCFRFGDSFETSLQKCINYRGDADSTGSITGQLCGAFYGVTTIQVQLLNNALRWDNGENLFRAILLCPPFHPQNGVDQKDNLEWNSSGCDKTAEEVINLRPCNSLLMNFMVAILKAVGLKLGEVLSVVLPRNIHFVSEICDRLMGNRQKTLESIQNAALIAASCGEFEAYLSATDDLQIKFGTSIANVLFLLDGNECTALQLAAAKGHIQIVEFVLLLAKHNCPSVLQTLLDHTGTVGCSALLLSLANGFENVAISLLQCGASIHGSIAQNRNVAFLISSKGYLQAAHEIIHSQSQLEKFKELACAVDAKGFNALHAAVRMNQAKLCELLIDIGIRIDKKTRDGSNVLHLACRDNVDFDIVMKILDSCSLSSLSQKDCFGNTPLHIAVNAPNVKAVQAICRCFPMSCLISQDDDGDHPLHSGISLLRRYASELKHTDTLDDEYPTSTPQTDKIQNTILCLKELISSGYPISCLTFCGATIFHYLCKFTDEFKIDLVLFLTDYLKSSTILNVKDRSMLIELYDESGWSCLHYAKAPTFKGKCSDLAFQALETFTTEKFKSSFDSSLPRNTDNKTYLMRRGPHNRISEQERKSILGGDHTMQGVGKYIKFLSEGPRIVVLIGAGVSTSAGIQDFRSEKGLLANEATKRLFSTEFLCSDPTGFYELTRKLFLPVVDKMIKPTKAHALLRVFKDLGWLTRVYTQNVDMLEYRLLSESDVVECHGSFRHAYCMRTNCAEKQQTANDMDQFFWDPIRRGELPLCPKCSHTLRPAVTFFGEPLSEKFVEYSGADMQKCNFLLVMGTSLVVYPVATLPNLVHEFAVLMLINRETSGCFQYCDPCNTARESVPEAATLTLPNTDKTIQPWNKVTYRDVFYQGDCNLGAEELACVLGLQEKLRETVTKFCL